MNVKWEAAKSILVDRFAASAPRSDSKLLICFDYPGLVFSQDRIQSLLAKQKCGDQEAVAAVDDAVKTAWRLIDRKPIPIKGPLQVPLYYRHKAEHRAIHHRIRKDAMASHAFAMAYVLSGERELLAKAKDFLFSWVQNLEAPRTLSLTHRHTRGDNPVVISYVLPQFIMCADLLKGCGALTLDEHVCFSEWLGPFVRYMEKEERIKNNHHIFQTLFLMCSAHYLNDDDLFNQSVNNYLNGLRSQVSADGFLSYELVRGPRAATYTLMALEGLFQIAHIASLHGFEELIDRKSYFGGSLKHALDHLLAFVTKEESWSFVHRNLDRPGFAHKGSFTIGEIARQNSALYDWAYVFEPALSWWKDPKYEFLREGRPYGLFPSARTYTLSYSTLAFLKL